MNRQNNLSGYLNETINPERQGSQNTQQFDTYQTLFGINLVHRFPGVPDLDAIEVPNIREIARFSLVCSRVAWDVWQEVTQDVQGQRSIPRQTRAA